MKEAFKSWKYALVDKDFEFFSYYEPLDKFNIKLRSDDELGDLVYFLSPPKENLQVDCLSKNHILEVDKNREE